jgi:hypothetical protein
VAIVIAQIFIIVASNPICVGTNNKINGNFISTVLTGTAVIFLYRYWDSITEGKIIIIIYVIVVNIY